MPSASASADVPAVAHSPDFLEVATVDAEIFPLDDAILACGPSCATGAGKPNKVDIQIIDRKGKKGGIVSPEGYFRQAMNNMDSIFKDARSMRFAGSYPDRLVSWMNIPYDRSGYGDGPTLKWSPSGWDPGGGFRESRRADCGDPLSVDELFVTAREACGERGLAARAKKFLPALVKIDTRGRSLLVLPSGEPLLFDEKGVSKLVDGAWQETPGQWHDRVSTLVALDDGRVLLSTPGKTFLLDKDLSARPLYVERKTPSAEGGTTVEEAPRATLRLIGDEVWVTYGLGDTVIALPKEGTFKPYWPEVPADEKDAPLHDVPIPSKFTDACSTPFVTFAAKPDPGFDLSIAALEGHPELGEDPVFLEIFRDGNYFFGAQFKTADHAKTAMELAKAQALHPQLGCLDATSHIPDLTAPPKGVRVYWVNLANRVVIVPR